MKALDIESPFALVDDVVPGRVVGASELVDEGCHAQDEEEPHRREVPANSAFKRARVALSAIDAQDARDDVQHAKGRSESATQSHALTEPTCKEHGQYCDAENSASCSRWVRPTSRVAMRGPPPPAGSKRQEDNQRSTTEDDIELPDKRRTDPAAHLVLQPAMVPAVVRQQHVLQISQTVLVLNRDMIRPTHGTPRIQLPIPVRHHYL